jgi:hypothetical protein
VSTPLRPADRAYSLSTRRGWEEFVTAPPRQRPDLLALAQLRKLPETARAEYEEARSVWHANLGPLRTPQMRAVHEQLDDIVEANRQDGDKVKGAAVIDAHPGLGKSTIAQVFAREFHQRQVSLYGPLTSAGHDRIPVAHVCLTSSTSKRSFNAMLCRFFGLPGHDRGNADELGHKAADAVLSCDVRLCVVDDVHFLDPRRRDGRDVANHFKYLANTFPVSFVFVGVGLERRGLVSEGLADYLFARSTGHFASLMTLIARGCRRAVRTGTEKLTRDLLDQVRNDAAAEAARQELLAAFDAGKLSARPATARAKALAAG